MYNDKEFLDTLGEDFVDYLNTVSLASNAATTLGFIMTKCYDLEPSKYDRNRYLRLVLYKIADLLGRMHSTDNTYRADPTKDAELYISSFKAESIYRAYIRYYYDHICKT